jgi:hypothetical protein
VKQWSHVALVVFGIGVAAAPFWVASTSRPAPPTTPAPPDLNVVMGTAAGRRTAPTDETRLIDDRAGGSAATRPGDALAAKVAYEQAAAWSDANPTKPAEAARRWGAVEQSYPGTIWGVQGARRRMDAEYAADRRADGR